MKGVEIEDDAFKHIEAMISSMTNKERSNPSLLNGSRKQRIARGCGRSVSEVNQMIKQFSDMGKVMRMMQGGGMKNMMKIMEKGGSPNIPMT
jgi:signal recognition particle subunit SRP54